jgi:hypothetical protein
VKVQHVEMGRCISDLVEQIQVCGGVGSQRVGIQPERLPASGDELRFRPCVGGREQDDLVTEIGQSVAEIRYDSFRATI